MCDTFTGRPWSEMVRGPTQYRTLLSVTCHSSNTGHMPLPAATLAIAIDRAVSPSGKLGLCQLITFCVHNHLLYPWRRRASLSLSVILPPPQVVTPPRPSRLGASHPRHLSISPLRCLRATRAGRSPGIRPGVAPGTLPPGTPPPGTTSAEAAHR